MSWYGNLPIRRKIEGVVMIVCGAALLVATGAFTFYDRTNFLAERTQDLSASSQMVASNSTAALAFGDAKTASELLHALQAKTYVLHAALYDKDGRVLAQYSRAAAKNFVPPAAAGGRSGIVNGDMWLFQNIDLNGESIGTIFVQAGLGDLNERLIRYIEIASLVILISLGLAFALTSRLQQVISGPIRTLADTATSVSKGENYSLRVTKTGNDEIGFLFDEFNGMLDRIQERDRALQAAHAELEERVAERTSYLNALIENSPLAIMVLDSEQKVQLCNPAFEELFQYSREELAAKFIADLFPHENALAEVSLGSEIAAEKTLVSMTTRRKRKDGTFVDVELHLVPLTVKGRTLGSLGIYQDVSERIRTAEAMQGAKEAAEASSRSKSEFLANMSHEIRTPMNGIMGMVELVLDSRLDSEQREYLNIAKVSADSLLSLINDILDYSKIEAGKLDIDAIEFNLGETLGDTMKTLSLRAHQKGLELAFEIEPDVADALTGDPGRLRQIVVNLVGNAIKFTERGEVVLFVKREPQKTENEMQLHFTVADSGIGIAAAKQADIFEAFKQADGSMTRKHGGTGLGLTISSRLVELMGGTIWVESELGKGSRFHFTANFGLQQMPTRNIVPRDPQTLRDMRVLVVDDNATNRQILTKMLINWHMDPVAVDGGAQAIVSLREANGLGRVFSLILLDAQMPDMDGFALAEAVKRNPDWSGATVMMLSSAGQRGDALRCRELGVAAYLTKPVRSSELLEAILAALGTRAKGNKSAELVTTHSLRSGRIPLRALLAEDNAVNQLVAVRLMEKAGHSVVVAMNGKQAVEAWRKEPFDVILMDVQMPEMNGWEATRAIRVEERSTGGHVPIIALTAHAMKGDQELCMAAGMDLYLSKPIRTSDLLAALGQVQKFAVVAAEEKPPVPPGVSHIDLAEALLRLDGDRNLFDQVALLFRSECPSLLAEIRSGLTESDSRKVQSVAHALKGSSAILGASALSQAAAGLETLARTDDMGTAQMQMHVVEREVDSLMAELEIMAKA